MPVAVSDHVNVNANEYWIWARAVLAVANVDLRTRKRRIQRDWAEITCLSEVGSGLLGRRVGGFVFGVELRWSRGAPRPYYSPELFGLHVAALDDHIAFSFKRVLLNPRGGVTHIPFGLHDEQYRAAAQRALHELLAPGNGAIVDARHVLARYREQLSSYVSARMSLYQGMALIAADGEGPEAGLRVFEEARSALPAAEFLRAMANVEPLLRDPVKLLTANAAALVRLRLTAMAESAWHVRRPVG